MRGGVARWRLRPCLRDLIGKSLTVGRNPRPGLFRHQVVIRQVEIIESEQVEDIVLARKLLVTKGEETVDQRLRRSIVGRENGKLVPGHGVFGSFEMQFQISRIHASSSAGETALHRVLSVE